MLELFRSNHLSNSILLIPYIFLLRIKFFFDPWTYSPIKTDTAFSTAIFSWLENKTILSFILSGAIVFIIAMMANVLVMKYRVSRDQTLFPALMFALISVLAVDMIMLNPVMLSCLFIGLALINLVMIYKKQDTAGKLLNAGIFLALAQLFYSSAFVFFILGFAAIIILRSPKTKDYLQFLSGIFVVYFLYGTILYWNDNLNLLSDGFNHGLSFRSLLKFENHIATSGFISLIIWIIASIINYTQFTQKKSLQAIKNLGLMYWIYLAGFFSLFFAGTINFSHFYLIAIPSAIFAALYLEMIKKKFLAEALHILVIAIVLFFQFQ